MQTEQLDEKTKAIVIEVADIFYEMDVEEIPEDYPREKEKEAHVNAIHKQLRRPKPKATQNMPFITVKNLNNEAKT